MNKEEREKKIKQKEDSYYSLRNKLDSIRWQLKDVSENKKRTYAFKMLDIAIGLSLEQIKKDYDRYVRRIRIMGSNEDVSFMQRALNREKLKNAELEKKIEEAKTSSGLFIGFVREKLGI
jgi:hypothetical protein